MGGGTYREEDLVARKSAIAASGGDTFAYSTKMARSNPNEVKCYPTLAIDKKKIRESCDSATHPKSNALAVIFDVTGSMGSVPRELEEKLKDLMAYFLKRKYLPNIHILFGAVGDSTSDRVPLQIGEFEPGAQELMDFFQRVYLEGQGGPYGRESYQNALYFMARHTVIDCFEKRGKKGYIFMFGDELPYDVINAKEIKNLMGGTGPQGNITIAQIIREVKEKYNVFFIIPLDTSGSKYPTVWDSWRSLLGEEFVLGMEETEQVCELIGTIVGTCEGRINAQDAIENLRKCKFGNEYLDIAKNAFKKLYGINMVADRTIEKKGKKSDNVKTADAGNNKGKDKKKTLKI